MPGVGLSIRCLRSPFWLSRCAVLQLILSRIRYFLFLLLSVVFIFLVATTYWQLVRDLANSPAKVPEKLAIALSAGRARCHFLCSFDDVLAKCLQTFLSVLCHSAR